MLLADHTKVGDDHLCRFADISQIDLLITDAGLDSEAVNGFTQAGVEVVLA